MVRPIQPHCFAGRETETQSLRLVYWVARHGNPFNLMDSGIFKYKRVFYESHL